MSIKIPDLVQNLIDYYIWKSKHNKVMEDYHRTIEVRCHTSNGIYLERLYYKGVWAYNIHDVYAMEKYYYQTLGECGIKSSIRPIPTLKNMEIPYITKHGIVSRNLMKYLEERSMEEQSMEERSMEERSNKLTNNVRTN
jgi:hypothetical protein